MIWVAVGALVIVVLGGTIWFTARGAPGRARAGRTAIARAVATAPTAAPPGRRAAVVINPSKVADPERSHDRADRVFRRAGWREPLWLQTTVDDPGRGQAEAALDADVDLIVVEGGDGTVREVADAVAGTAVPIALVPLGTGNLLARELGIPLADGAAALDIAVHGHTRRIDVGRLVLRRPGGDRPHERTAARTPGAGAARRPEDEPSAADREHAFLVMAGLGFDAEVMANTQPALKQRVGWWAYVMTGASRLRGHRTRVEIVMDGEVYFTRRVRSVVIGNCGELTAGVRLLPDAVIDDGWLDVVVVSPRGVSGWAGVVVAVLSRSRRSRTTLEWFRCRSIEIRADRALEAQLDGDPAGLATELVASVAHLALHVQVPPHPEGPPA